MRDAPQELDRYQKLGEWPKHRPAGIVFSEDIQTRTVYVCDMRGTRLLAIPTATLHALVQELETVHA